jgi:hypothetical protein
MIDTVGSDMEFLQQEVSAYEAKYGVVTFKAADMSTINGDCTDCYGTCEGTVSCICGGSCSGTCTGSTK